MFFSSRLSIEYSYNRLSSGSTPLLGLICVQNIFYANSYIEIKEEVAIYLTSAVSKFAGKFHSFAFKFACVTILFNFETFCLFLKYDKKANFSSPRVATIYWIMGMAKYFSG